MIENIRLAFQGIWGHKMRSVLTMLGIIIGIAAIITIVSTIQGTNEQIKEVFDNDARIVATLDKDTCNSREEALVEIYRKLRPGDPPTVESSESLLEGLFYDRRRYDISNVGRYKFNKKLGLRSRIAGHMLAAPVVDPMTGEIIAEAGEVLTRERAEEIAEAGVNDVYLDVDGKSIRVFGNGMVDMKHYVDFDPAELGIKELVRGIILRQLMEQYEPEQGMDVLVLYDCIHFLEDFKFY